MKNIQNSFSVSGFVGFSEVKMFQTASVCHLSLSVSKLDKATDERTSAFLSAEAWKKNENIEEFEILSKGNMVTLEGYFRPEEWVDEAGDRHNKVVMAVTKFYPTEEKSTEKRSKKK